MCFSRYIGGVSQSWHEGLIFNRKQNGIYLWQIAKNLLRNRKQRALVNGQVSHSSDVKAVVPQRSILGPLMFLIYNNDLLEGLSSNAKLFSDGTFCVIHDRNISALELNSNLAKINRWAFQ